MSATSDLDIAFPNTRSTRRAPVSCAGSAGRSTRARWVQGFRWSAGVFAGEVPDYTTVDIGASWRVTDLVQLGVNVANVADSVHRQTFGGDQITRRALVNMTLTW
jgi:outer membrane receptor for ferrienterochelin and colicin